MKRLKAFLLGTAITFGLMLPSTTNAAPVVLNPSDTVTVSPTGNLSPGSPPGDIVVRERGTNAVTGSEGDMHIAAFLNFDLSGVTSFNIAEETATFSLDFQGRINVNNHFLSVAQVTGGAWNSTTNLPSYNWGTHSPAPAGPGSQIRTKTIVSNVGADPFGTYSVDISDIMDAWINGSEGQFGLTVFLKDAFTGAGFGSPQISIVPEPSTSMMLACLGLGVSVYQRRRRILY